MYLVIVGFNCFVCQGMFVFIVVFVLFLYILSYIFLYIYFVIMPSGTDGNMQLLLDFRAYAYISLPNLCYSYAELAIAEDQTL